MRHFILSPAVIVALALSGAAAPALGDTEAPASAQGAGVGAALDAALGPIQRAVPYGRPFRLAVMPVRGPGDGETGLGRYAAARAVDALVARGVEVIDAGALRVLREADRARAGGPTGEPLERLAGLYLEADGALSGTIHEVDGAFEVALRLTDARTGKVMETGTARLAKAAAAPLVGETAAPAADPAEPPPAASARGLALDRRVFFERRKPGGGFEPPAEWTGAPLATGDRIHVAIRAVEACHVSVVVFESTGTVRTLVAPRPLDAGAELHLPEGGDDTFFPLTPPSGSETFFIIAERAPAKAKRAAEGVEAIEKAAAEARDADRQAAAVADDKGRAEAARRASDLWQMERLRITELRAELDSGAREFAYDFRLRQAFRSIASGAPLPDAVTARDLGKPEKGAAVLVRWEGGTASLATQRVEGSGRIVESFAIAHR